jgi:hypothetical protein
VSTPIGYCRTLGCIFEVAFDPGDDDWIAVQVYRDGNAIELGRFATEEEAEDFAAAERDRQLEENEQFGVGA